ncbi:uncharacterized protein PHACADRAFT_178749 [Phanerochaete carnosa HHB-10118-sp]|uniref:Uncharacterized protein n=1 Tax=Phanerochaete carnosa (strain HHB-10118-sp) TaxID=650164 RepID=K5VTJ6_PHACS|nr:uncharacterized protein PHACADRAFT_178749 [Phanerochaete carnosa HHB-10118-sp]EKM50125.1 hypothetical protein PHACADRAFT_178749 [Phanerochaete carnosa HHB-10118-sp]
MKFLALAASALTLAGAAVAQEAVRFGIVSVSPSTIKPGETFTVHYNSTLAAHQPVYYDAYIQGILSSGFVQPQYLLQRTTFPTDGTKNIYFNTTLPNIGYVNNASYSVWAYITYPVQDESGTSALEYGGVSYPVGIDMS